MHFQVTITGLYNDAFDIIDDQLFRCAGEELKGAAVAAKPGLSFLVVTISAYIWRLKHSVITKIQVLITARVKGWWAPCQNPPERLVSGKTPQMQVTF